MDFNDTMALENTSNYQKLAIHLEDALAISEDNLGLPNEHNLFDETFSTTCFDGERGQGLDNKIILPHGRKKLGGDCKNINGKYPLTKGWFMRELFSRDSNVPYALRFLVISILNCSKETLRWLIEDKKVKIFEIGFQVTSPELKAKAIEILTKKLYWFKKKYFSFIHISKNPTIKLISKPIPSLPSTMYSFIENSLTNLTTITRITNYSNELDSKLDKKGKILDLASWILGLVSPRPEI